MQREFVARGMVADLNVHWDEGNPHAHVMLTMREVTPEGFGRKVREWNQVGLLREWREHWADLANQHLLRAGFDVHVDHRSFKDQGVELEPTSHLGKAVDEMRARGVLYRAGAAAGRGTRAQRPADRSRSPRSSSTT